MNVGLKVGDTEGKGVGWKVGLTDGWIVGIVVGGGVGTKVGDVVGGEVGSVVGARVGAKVGNAVGNEVGSVVGDRVGAAVVGAEVGSVVGAVVGDEEGSVVGDRVGDEVGNAVGAVVGGEVGAVVRLATIVRRESKEITNIFLCDKKILLIKKSVETAIYLLIILCFIFHTSKPTNKIFLSTGSAVCFIYFYFFQNKRMEIKLENVSYFEDQSKKLLSNVSLNGKLQKIIFSNILL